MVSGLGRVRLGTLHSNGNFGHPSIPDKHNSPSMFKKSRVSDGSSYKLHEMKALYLESGSCYCMVICWALRFCALFLRCTLSDSTPPRLGSPTLLPSSAYPRIKTLASHCLEPASPPPESSVLSSIFEEMRGK